MTSDTAAQLLNTFNSTDRPVVLATLLANTLDPLERIDLIYNFWSDCDATRDYGVAIHTMLIMACDAIPTKTVYAKILSDEDRIAFDALPDLITVFRGGSAHGFSGMSWTLDIGVAERFARGHRGIDVFLPVIAEGKVSKDDILLPIFDREEGELLCRHNRVDIHTVFRHNEITNTFAIMPHPDDSEGTK